MLVVVDEPFGRGALRRDLGAWCVDEAASVGEARERIAAHRHAAWIVDAVVGDAKGIDILAWARTEGFLTPALITAFPDAERGLANEALFWGAYFAHKPISGEELRRFVVQALATPESLLSRTLRFAKLHKLTARETEVAVSATLGLSRVDTASRLGISEETVKSHAKNICAKTGVCGLAELVRLLLAESPVPPGRACTIAQGSHAAETSSSRRSGTRRVRPRLGGDAPLEEVPHGTPHRVSARRR